MFVKDATAGVLGRKKQENHKYVHRSNYTSEKSNKMVSSNFNLMRKKRKSSDILPQAK